MVLKRVIHNNHNKFPLQEFMTNFLSQSSPVEKGEGNCVKIPKWITSLTHSTHTHTHTHTTFTGFITLYKHTLLCLGSHDVSVYVLVQMSACPASPSRITVAAAVRGGRQALSPSPADRWLHQNPGIGDAAFLPRCIAAGCSPVTQIMSRHRTEQQRVLYSIK
jgi:hypothetical protein